MNSSNNIPGNSHFGGNLSREQIAELRNKKPGADLDKMDDFDKDAARGWEKASGGTELMNRLDKKFAPKSRFIYLALAILIIGISGTFFLLPSDHSQKPKIARATKVTVDKSDVVITEEIKSFEELPAALQIKPEQVVSNFKTKEKEEQTREQNILNEDQNDANDFVLPLKQVQPDSIKLKPTLANKKSAKEVYLSGFKLIDYRLYRDKPAIQSQQMILSGTPADQEKGEIQHDDPAWKTIDVPYHDYLSQTMEQFKYGNFRQALNRSKSILDVYPEDINALFYGGLCYYNLSKMDQAIDAFQKVIANPFSNFDEEAFWYLANAYDLKNEKAKAKELFQLISSQKGYYAKQADKMLKR